MAIKKRIILDDNNFKIEITTGFANMVLFTATTKVKGGDRMTGKVKGRTDKELIEYCTSKLDLNYSVFTHGLNLTEKLERIERAAI